MERICHPDYPHVSLEFEPSGEREFGPCPDCGQLTRRVWGFVYRNNGAVAAYFVEWTPAHQQRDATFDLIIGNWGERAHAGERKAVSLAFKLLDSSPSFMVQDATGRKVGSSSLVSQALTRDEVIGHPIAEDAFEICDVVYLTDPRIADLRQ